MGTLQEYEDGRLANRSKVQIPVGDYILTLDGKWMLFGVTHRDGKAIPKPLQGQWKEAKDFRKAAEKYHGPEYSLEGLKGRDQRIADAAAKAGVSPKAYRLVGASS